MQLGRQSSRPDILAYEHDFDEPGIAEYNLQVPWGDGVMKARLIPTKLGLNSTLGNETVGSS